SKQLHELAETLKQEFVAENLSSSANVLWEGQTEILDNGKIRYFGYTPNYLRVACDVDSAIKLENQILPAKLSDVAETKFVAVELI
ncbi:MAG: tRNA (N(6)-L-threonylcarbamoyladenosine(37)-C(2))-methylthiotransferase MtaB, partial [Methylomonas lenta]|nr:tRNA (N(6)-L-threonylcarbamoyladenosine(37)-C(2))-methylthiotransferase MtaB [Methylomonas lenta]